MRVLIAGDGAVTALLKKEFPDLFFLTLKGFSVKYPRNKHWFFLKLLLQIPRAFMSIGKERRWLKKIITEYKIDAVISDNRMGLYNKTIPCIYITHQLTIKTGGAGWLDKLSQKIHYSYINKFKECWVPDFEKIEQSLAGELSHPKKNPAVPVKYLGPLSRFKTSVHNALKYDNLVLLSGPEPQRSILEEILLKQIKEVPENFLFVRGLPETKATLPALKNASFINHLPSAALNEAILQSKLIIGRCGYTTVMDLAKLGKKAILIPTPGQPEQEYLAEYLLKKRMAYTVDQGHFNLAAHNKESAHYNFLLNDPDSSIDTYKLYIRQFIASL